MDNDNDENLIDDYSKKKDYRKITEEEKGILNDIQTLDEKIQKILDKQYNEYSKAFDDFLKQKKEKINEEVVKLKLEHEEYKKTHNIQLIKSERDFFRTEAIRLNGLCKDMSSRIEEISFKMKLLSEDLNNMTTKWKESENVNKQLMVEIASSVQELSDIRKENEQLKEEIQNIQTINKNIYNNNIEGNINEQNIDESLIEKLKSELKKEKNLYHKNLNELNKLNLERNQLEFIFSDCLEEAKKNIQKRKMRETFTEGFMAPTKKLNDFNVIKFNHFLPSDKIKLIESFLANDDVINVINEIVFHKPKKEIDNVINKDINILNDRRINDNNVKEFGKTADDFTTFLKKKGASMGFKFNLSNGFGRKTQLNFGFKKIK